MLRRSHLLTATALGLAVVAVPAVARASWLASGTGTATGAATSLPQTAAAAPAVSVNGATVQVNFSAVATSNGATTATSYTLKRYTAASGGSAVASVSCTRSASAPNCTDTPGSGTFYYSYTASLGTNWVGAESARSGAAVVNGAVRVRFSSCSAAATCPTTGPASVALIKNNQAGAHDWTAKVTLVDASNNPVVNSTGAAITVSVTKTTTGTSITYSSGSALTIPAGASESSNTFTHSIAAVGNGGGTDTVSATTNGLTAATANVAW